MKPYKNLTGRGVIQKWLQGFFNLSRSGFCMVLNETEPYTHRISLPLEKPNKIYEQPQNSIKIPLWHNKRTTPIMCNRKLSERVAKRSGN